MGLEGWAYLMSWENSSREKGPQTQCTHKQGKLFEESKAMDRQAMDTKSKQWFLETIAMRNGWKTGNGTAAFF